MGMDREIGPTAVRLYGCPYIDLVGGVSPSPPTPLPILGEGGTGTRLIS